MLSSPLIAARFLLPSQLTALTSSSRAHHSLCYARNHTAMRSSQSTLLGFANSGEQPFAYSSRPGASCLTWVERTSEGNPCAPSTTSGSSSNFCDSLGYNLAEEFFWYNPAKLPSPIEWVNKRKIRAKDAVNTVWWFSKTDCPKADVSKVLVPYSDRMKTLLKNPAAFYTPKERPSGHDIAEAFGKDNGGAIPSNLLQIPNTESNSHYLRICKLLGRESHPARFPADLPKFFINFLTDPGDVVLDIFSGSNTTGYVAETLRRRWVSIELDRAYAALSAVRFMEDWTPERIRTAVEDIESGKSLLIAATPQQELPLTTSSSSVPDSLQNGATQTSLFP